MDRTTRPASATEQSAAIRQAAFALLRGLAPAQQDEVVFPFPKGQRPMAIGFGPMPGRPRDFDHQRRDIAFDIDGNPYPDPGLRGGPSGGRPHGAPPAAGEKYGDSVWTNFPVSIVPRPGLRMGGLSVIQQDAIHDLLRTVLSPMGYQKVLDIMAADQKVADAGPDYAAGLAVYTVALFGQPSATAPWMLQFGGHHLGLNVTFIGDRAVCAPLHTGILPARFEANGRIVRGLGRENDMAFDLVTTFTPDQLDLATIDHDVSDLILGPGRPDATVPLQGLRGADMTDDQRTTMFDLLSEWVSVLNDAHAADRLDEIRRALPETRFAWSGPLGHEPTYNGKAYFRIHGPNLVIEHAPQSNQGGYDVHVHTIMRDLKNDYARQLI